MSKNLVYSTDQGRIRNTDKKDKAREDTAKSKFPNDGIVRISRETKGRKGAGVTLVNGLKGDEKELKAIAKALKAHCGCGGSIKNGVIEIQGDNREKVKSWLEKKNYTVKLAGG